MYILLYKDYGFSVYTKYTLSFYIKLHRYSIGNMGRKSEAEPFDELVVNGQKCSKTKESKKITNQNVQLFFSSEIHSYANGGGYIPCSEKYVGKKVYVVVLK